VPLAGKIPGGAALTGATGGVGSDRPHNALVPLAGKIPGGAALTGATGACDRVARIRRWRR